MDKLQLLDAIERYLGGQMTDEERFSFEELRKTNPDVDLLVVEHSLFFGTADYLWGTEELPLHPP